MENLRSFDLPTFMLSHFPGVELGGDLLWQWPVGIRFEIGVEQLSRARKLHEAIFGGADDCILVSRDGLLEDGETDIRAPRITPLFSTPDVFREALSSQFETVDVSPFDLMPYRLTWKRLPLSSLNAARMFQAIADADLGGVPAIAGSVYTIDERARIIMHMYDDRGLDMIAAETSTLLPLYERFGDWILDNQRRKINLRFTGKASGVVS